MKIINLYGGPGTGKSTTAALIFGKLKQDGYNVELVREYAKDVCYEQRYNLLKHQLYITAKQYKRLKDIQDYGKVPLVITDSPLKLSLFYGKELPYYESFKDIILNLYNEFNNCDVFIKRVKPYNPSGRVQTEEEAKDIDIFFRTEFKFDFFTDGDQMGVNQLYHYIKQIYLTKSHEIRSTTI